MKKLLNDVDTVLAEALDGFAAAHSDIVTLGAEREFVRRRHLKPGKVALISGGGAGHEPLHAGFVGHGMLDAACPGQVFTSPTPNQMLAAAESVDTGAGVLFIVKNYSGDMMNFQMAADMLDRDNATVLVNDDVAVENSTYTTGRRGVAGNFFVMKAVGAAAEAGAELDEVIRIGEKVNSVTRTMGLALTACTPPSKGSPLFELGDDEIEIGVGIHGEPGRRRAKWAPANELVDELLDAVVSDLPFSSGDRVALMINGLGGTPISELYLLYGIAHEKLEALGITIARNYVGEYCTSLDMAGASLTLVKLDPEIDELLAAPAEIAYRVF